MTIQPALFHLPPVRPTIRAFAQMVKQRGTAALPHAARRSDQAVYQEITCHSALNKVEGMPFRWTLNPYRGCTHGCHYCFARRYQNQLELDSGEQFSSVILIKINFAEVVRQELARPFWNRELVAIGTATDPYQPIEGHYRLTRRSLEALCEHATPVGLVTKGPMVVRDSDVLADLGRHARCTVYISIPTVDEDTWRALEPGTAPPLQRLRAVRKLVDAGIHTGVLIAPVVPGLTSQPRKLEQTVKAIADHGAAFVGANLLHLEGGTRRHFLKYLSREFPALLPRYERLYTRKYAPKVYTNEVYAMIGLLRARYGLAPRESRASEQPSEQIVAALNGGATSGGKSRDRATQGKFFW
ncbi:MAG: radical SAM protein [Acidobacteria bacterium]|nr:radical SAM protein [Acidobacteriota bacterium]